MDIFFYTILFTFGALFGSFGSVIIYRLKSGESGILGGRSHCAKCNHILGALELIPIFSWIKNLGKCKYCKDKVSAIYPFLEISTGILFGLIGYFLIDFNLILVGDINEIIKLFFWLIIGFITIIYSFYDILFLEIHDGVMLTGIVFTIFAIILQSFGIINIIPYFNNYYENSNILIGENLIQNTFSIILLIWSIMGLYIIMLKELELKYDFLILLSIGFLIYLFNGYFILNYEGLILNSNIIVYPAINALIGVMIIFIFFFLQIFVSKGAWMGGGDLRIAILIGLIMGYSLSIEGLFATYIVGSIIGVSAIIFSKFKNGFNTTFNTQIPFGPFLALGFFIVIFAGKSLTEILEIYL